MNNTVDDIVIGAGHNGLSAACTQAQAGRSVLGNYKTPYPGLYLAGAGSHPSGGVCGWAGRLAAETALRDQ